VKSETVAISEKTFDGQLTAAIAEAGTLDLDNASAEICEPKPGIRTGKILAEFEDKQAVEWKVHVAIDSR
jgi:hypothetical protein